MWFCMGFGIFWFGGLVDFCGCGVLGDLGVVAWDVMCAAIILGF